MEFKRVTKHDLTAVKALVSNVSQSDVLPLLNTQGQHEYQRVVLPGIEATFATPNFTAIKAILNDHLVGFAALRDGNYLTHLFVAKSAQGKGIGGQLLAHLLHSTTAETITLRSSVNAVSFYHSQGFEANGEEAEFNGIRFVPMSLQRTEKMIQPLHDL